MVIGGIGKSVFILDQNKEVLEIPKEAQFLRANTIIHKEKWKTIKLSEPMTIKRGIAYFKTSKKWYKAGIGDVVAGDILYLDENLELGGFE